MTEQHDDRDVARLRALYQDGNGANDGPSDEKLIALILNELTSDERDDVLDGMLRSPDAAERYRILKDLHAASQPRKGRRNLIGLGIAASIVLAFAVLLQPVDERLPTLRGVADQAEPAGGAVLAEPPQNLQWKALDGDRQYRVTLYDDSGNALWSHPAMADTRYALNEVDRRAMQGTTEFFWLVEADNGDQLGPYWFKVDGE